ncbi:MAG: hypothetical protein WAU91_13880 [Desulfatitalea sp.]
MKNIISFKDRNNVLKIVGLSVCVLELIIVLLTMTFQQDEVKRSETQITKEMAQDYMNHPEKLKENERVAYNSYSSAGNQTYLLVKTFEKVVPFPWKAWILISVGAPIGIAFLVLLFSKAYFQTVDPDESKTAENQGKFVSALNRLSQISSIWFMLVCIIAIFLVWYIPEVVKYTGEVTTTWLARYWWIPVILICIVVSIVLFWIYLQYKLKSRAMNMEMELAKFKFLQLQGDHRFLIQREGNSSAPLLEATEEKEDSTGEDDISGMLNHNNQFRTL